MRRKLFLEIGRNVDAGFRDDECHDTFALQLIGHANFLYVADCKLCTRENMSYIADRQGRFLTVLPRTRAETDWFRGYPEVVAAAVKKAE